MFIFVTDFMYAWAILIALYRKQSIMQCRRAIGCFKTIFYTKIVLILVISNDEPKITHWEFVLN